MPCCIISDDLGLFREPEVEAATVEYLMRLCKLAGELGARVLVFGSPRNRRRGDIPLHEAMERAALLFLKVAAAAADWGVCFCIEPLRPEETDFISSAQEGFRLVNMINNRGFGLHLMPKQWLRNRRIFHRSWPRWIAELSTFTSMTRTWSKSTARAGSITRSWLKVCGIWDIRITSASKCAPCRITMKRSCARWPS